MIKSNKGWGVWTFIILLGLLMLALLIAAKLINDLGGSLPRATDRVREISPNYVDFYTK